MRRAPFGILTAFMLFASALSAQDGIQKAKIKKIDIDKLQLTLTVGDKDRTFTLTDQTKVFGSDAKEVKDRLRGLKEGAEVMFKAESKDGKEVLIGVKPLGADSGQPGQVK